LKEQRIFFLNNFLQRNQIYFMSDSYSQKQAKQNINQQQSYYQDIENLDIYTSEQTEIWLPESPQPQKLEQQAWRLKAKAIVWAIALSVLPVLAVGTAIHYPS
jgi:methyl-accepting chemotaxis protein PixJ